MAKAAGHLMGGKSKGTFVVSRTGEEWIEGKLKGE
jgi:hypothetical protein